MQEPHLHETDSPEGIASRTYRLLCHSMEHREAAMLTTVSEDGRPHATWMATMTSLDFRTLFTLTSPDSRKVKNIRSNPHVEWLFSDSAKKELVYLEGSARILEDVAEIKRAWNLIPGKERAYFLGSFNSGPGFAVVETQIESVTYCVPAENWKTAVNLHLLSAQSIEAAGSSPIQAI